MNDFSEQRRATHDYGGTAREYADLGIENTFFIAFRELQRLIEAHSLEGAAVDVGCGGGRSTRFLKSLGFKCIGIDIEPSQVEQSKSRDPSGDYRTIESGRVPVNDGTADLTLSCIVLLECPSRQELENSVSELARVTKPGGTVIIVTNTDDSLRRNWASFECDFPENQSLQSGDKAKVIVRGTGAVLYDFYWTDGDYRTAFEKSGLEVVSLTQPLADGSEPFEWVSEKEKANWSIYVLKRAT